jgi:hypothetical protein
MSRRALLLLAALAAGLLLILATLQLADDAPPGVGDPLFPNLRAELAEISTVRISTGGEQVVATLELRGDTWVVAERDDWAADTQRLRALLIGLVEARRVEERSANPALYPRLGVDPLDDPSARGTGIAIETPSGRLALIIGDSGAGGGDFFHARREDEPAAWLVSGRIDVPRSTGEWLAADLLDVAMDEVVSVTLLHPDGERVRLVRQDAGGGAFAVLDMPAGRSLLHASVAEATAAALAGLQLEDVAPAEQIFDDQAQVVTTLVETRDERVISLQATRRDDGDWLTVESGLDEDGRLAGRAFRIPRARFMQLTRRLEDLLLPE